MSSLLVVAGSGVSYVRGYSIIRYRDSLHLTLVKNVVLTGFGHITLLDLDTIDLSNLNRQFLFRKKDVKQPKSLVCSIFRTHIT